MNVLGFLDSPVLGSIKFFELIIGILKVRMNKLFKGLLAKKPQS